MFALNQKLRACRESRRMTQKQTADALGVAPQTVSKWERGETCPDITMLPAVCSLFGITADELLGMDRLREQERIGNIYARARTFLRSGEWQNAIALYEEALRSWPGDAGLLTDLAMALALAGGDMRLGRASELCCRVLENDCSIKVQHTARAALCYIQAKAGKAEQAMKTAALLPHARESREVVREQLMSCGSWDAQLFELSTGERMEGFSAAEQRRE